MEFEWHEQKAKTNLKKHNVSFEEAVTSFYDAHQIAFEDPEHNEDEFREILMGHSKNGHLLLVVYTVLEKTIRLISARLATKKEAKDYAKGI